MNPVVGALCFVTPRHISCNNYMYIVYLLSFDPTCSSCSRLAARVRVWLQL